MQNRQSKKERAKLIRKVLNSLYPNPPVSLKHHDAFSLLIAVILSAQCTDARVNEITPILFARAKNPKEMVKLGETSILEIIRPCGLGPSKAKSIYKLSQILIDKYGGEVPASFEELEELPGVGHKSASVVLAQWYKIPTFPVDTHVHRCAKRWGLSSGKSVKQTEEDLKELFPEKIWISLHLQMIYFAREYCPAKQHNPAVCPICKHFI